MEINTYMQNILLRDTDQMSMAHSLEVRVPFLDHRLVEFVLSVKDDHWGEVPIVLLENSKTIIIKEKLKIYCENNLPKHMQPKYFLDIDKFPRYNKNINE